MLCEGKKVEGGLCECGQFGSDFFYIENVERADNAKRIKICDREGILHPHIGIYVCVEMLLMSKLKKEISNLFEKYD